MKRLTPFLLRFLVPILLLAIIPGSASDYTLDIYGNANMDDMIDGGDIEYVEGIIEGANEETELADANYDGKIDKDDIAQIELIITGEETELTVIDESGKIVTIEEPVERIVICHSMFAEVLKTLDAKDRIVGIPSYMADYTILYPDLCRLPTTGSTMTPDTEAIISLYPDLVIVYGSWAENLDEDLNDIAPVIRLTYRPFCNEEEIMMLGELVGKRNEAKELLDFFDQSLSTINDNVAKLSEEEKPRVYLEYSEYRTLTKRSEPTKGSGAHEMLIMAGGINIASDITTDPDGGPFVDPEWVITQNPDIIIRRARSADASNGYTEDDPAQMAALRESILNRPELADITAIKNGDVYCLSSDISAGGPSYWIGTIYMAKMIHPELFKELDPRAIHQEYLTRFQGLDYNLDEHGVFIYPSLEEC